MATVGKGNYTPVMVIPEKCAEYLHSKRMAKFTARKFLIVRMLAGLAFFFLARQFVRNFFAARQFFGLELLDYGGSGPGETIFYPARYHPNRILAGCRLKRVVGLRVLICANRNHRERGVVFGGQRCSVFHFADVSHRVSLSA